jgi:hypothetical protein
MELTTLLNRSKQSVLNLSVYEFRFLSFLLARVNKDKLPTHGYLAWPGTDQIIEFTGLSKPTIERTRKTLVSAGWMQYTPGHGAGSSNHYYINAAKIVSSYVASGYDAPDKSLYTTNIQEKGNKAHKKNTSGLMRGNVKPEPKAPATSPRVTEPGFPRWYNGIQVFNENELRQAQLDKELEDAGLDCPF